MQYPLPVTAEEQAKYKDGFTFEDIVRLQDLVKQRIRRCNTEGPLRKYRVLLMKLSEFLYKEMPPPRVEDPFLGV